MSLSVIVPEKSRGNKKCDKEEEEKEEEEEEERHIYVHSVEDSTLMPIFDQFSLSFVFLGVPKIGPNPYT